MRTKKGKEIHGEEKKILKGIANLLEIYERENNDIFSSHVTDYKMSISKSSTLLLCKSENMGHS